MVNYVSMCTKDRFKQRSVKDFSYDTHVIFCVFFFPIFFIKSYIVGTY